MRRHVTVKLSPARGPAPNVRSGVGFDDLEWAQLMTPALTTVRQPLAEMGRMAVSLLTRLLDNQSFEALHVALATRFSCGARRSAWRRSR